MIIRMDHVAPQLSGGTSVNDYISGAPGVCHFDYPGLARMRVSDGREITIEPARDVSMTEVRTMLLGVGLCALLNQRNILTLHGSSVCYRGKALLFLGLCGAGKSTLAAALCSHGAELMGDDIAAVSFSEGRAELLPGVPLQKLTPNTLKALNLSGEVQPSTEKPKAHILRHSSGSLKAMPIHRIYRLIAEERSDVELSVVSGMERFHAIRDNLFRAKIAKAIGHSNRCVRQCFELSGQCDVRTLKRPIEAFQLDLICQKIREDVG